MTKSSRNAVIAGYVRSPFTPATKGALARVRPDDLAAQVVKALIEHTLVRPEDVEDVIVGCAFPEGEQGFNIGRVVGLHAGIPESAGGLTVNRFCGSSMQAIHIAAGQILLGAGEVFVVAGVESMSRVPMLGFNPSPNPSLNAKIPSLYISMGETAERVASGWKISREDQEAFALRSQQRAAAAAKTGLFDAELVSIRATDQVVDVDGCVRPETTAEALGNLKAAFRSDGTVTAGTSSPLTDGAAAVLLCSEQYALARGLKPLARIRSTAVAGCAPEVMGIGPVAATRKALHRADIDLSAIDVVELNEAFASQTLACVRELGICDDTLNIDGGAIALGHPLGATGARIVGKAAALLQRTLGRYALSTQCIGGGQGIATILERA